MHTAVVDVCGDRRQNIVASLKYKISLAARQSAGNAHSLKDLGRVHSRRAGLCAE